MAALHVQGTFVYYQGTIRVPPFVRPERAQTVVFRGCQNVTPLLHASVAAELNILKQIGGHANILWLVDVVPTPPNPPTLVFDDRCLAPLLSSAPREGRVRQAHFLFLQMTLALAHLSALGLVHTNIHAGVIQIACVNNRYDMWWFRLTGLQTAAMTDSQVLMPQRWALPPECTRATHIRAAPEIDIWQLGSVLLHHMQNEPAPREFLDTIRKMIQSTPEHRPTIIELQSDTFRRPVIDFLMRRVGTSLEQELADAISSSLTHEIHKESLPAYAQPGPLFSLSLAVVQQMTFEYALVTLEQLSMGSSSLQMFVTAKSPDSRSQIADAASEDAKELWHILSLLRTICLETNITTRQNISVFVLCELQSDIFSLRKELESGIVTSDLVLFVRNVDHLLDYFYRCACAWERDGRVLPLRHPRATIIESALQRQEAANSHCVIQEWAAATKNDTTLLLQRFKEN